MENNTEIWKQIGTHPEYSVSNFGRVKSSSRIILRRDGLALPIRERILRPNVVKTGYAMVNLHMPGHKPRTVCVHTLVLEAFIGPRMLKDDASHLDGDRANNCLSNLIWESRSSNNLRKREHGTANLGELAPMAKLSNSQAAEIKLRYKNGEMQRELASEFGISQSGVSLLCSGKNWASLEAALVL